MLATAHKLPLCTPSRTLHTYPVQPVGRSRPLTLDLEMMSYCAHNGPSTTERTKGTNHAKNDLGVKPRTADEKWIQQGVAGYVAQGATRLNPDVG